MVSLQRCSQCAFDRPPHAKALGEGFSGDTKRFRPVGNALGDAVKCQQSIATGVAGLLSSGGPSAVVFRVAEIVLHSLNRVLRRRSLPHVAVERRKRLPLHTYVNSTSSVTSVVLVGLTSASRTHPLPDNVLWAVALAVRFVPASDAGSASPEPQFLAIDNRFGSTVADACPIAAGVTRSRFLKDCPLTEGNASQVCAAGQSLDRIMRSHSSLLHRFGLVRAAKAFQRLGCSHYITCGMGGLFHAE